MVRLMFQAFKALTLLCHLQGARVARPAQLRSDALEDVPQDGRPSAQGRARLRGMRAGGSLSSMPPCAAAPVVVVTLAEHFLLDALAALAYAD